MKRKLEVKNEKQSSVKKKSLLTVDAMFEKKKQFDLGLVLWFIFNYICMAYENEYFRKIGIGEKSRPTIRNRKSAKKPIGSSLISSMLTIIRHLFMAKL